MFFAELMKKIKACADCREFLEPRPVVFGSQDAKIFQISQAPSRKVHETGWPFNDVSGDKLIFEWYRITRQEFYDKFYITSISHCYPGKANTGDNKPPIKCAEKWLHKEMKAVDNKIYLIIGKYAANYFFPGKNLGTLAFNTQKLNGKPAFVMPHPSPLNSKWLKDNPEFERDRLLTIRKAIHRVL